jgi:hypothetical protein
MLDAGLRLSYADVTPGTAPVQPKGGGKFGGFYAPAGAGTRCFLLVR